MNRKDCIIILSNKGQMGSNAPVYTIHDVLLKILKGESYEFPIIPIELKLRNIIENQSLEKAIINYHELKIESVVKYDFSENQLNRLGYYYLNKNKYKEAIAIFKLNVETFPSSSNAYDSLGEAYMKNGQKDLAIKNYEKSLELNPENANAIEMLRQLRN
ncbi:MAG: tetratricopeptide repeat protein [Bacteroidales bacterium]|nr:tetratricopeptide repeat protein [Bacteroidales bacterium]